MNKLPKIKIKFFVLPDCCDLPVKTQPINFTISKHGFKILAPEVRFLAGPNLSYGKWNGAQLYRVIFLTYPPKNLAKSQV